VALMHRLTQLENQRFRKAAERFATFWKDNARASAREGRALARLRAVGYAGDSLADIAARDAKQPPEHQRLHAAMETAIFGMVLRTHDEGRIRASLAVIAPALGLRADDSAVLIINKLQASIEDDTL